MSLLFYNWKCLVKLHENLKIVELDNDGKDHCENQPESILQHQQSVFQVACVNIQLFLCYLQMGIREYSTVSLIFAENSRSIPRGSKHCHFVKYLY